MRLRPSSVSWDSPVAKSTSLARGDGAAGGIDRGGNIGLAQGAGKVGDDLRAHAHQILDLPLLLRKLALLLGDLAFLGGQLRLLRLHLALLRGHLALLRLQLRLLLVQLGERHLQLRLLRVELFLRLLRGRLRRFQQASAQHGQVFLRGGQFALGGGKLVLRAVEGGGLFVQLGLGGGEVSLGGGEGGLLGGDVRLALFERRLQDHHLVAARLVVVVHEEVLVEYVEQTSMMTSTSALIRSEKLSQKLFFSPLWRARPRREYRLMRMTSPPYCRSWGCGG